MRGGESMPREEVTQEELIELSESVPDQDLNTVQRILVGKFILWLRSFQCPDSFQAGTAYSMMRDTWDTIEEFYGR